MPADPAPGAQPAAGEPCEPAQRKPAAARRSGHEDVIARARIMAGHNLEALERFLSGHGF
jgi:hypothetical protein